MLDKAWGLGWVGDATTKIEVLPPGYQFYENSTCDHIKVRALRSNYLYQNLAPNLLKILMRCLVSISFSYQFVPFCSFITSVSPKGSRRLKSFYDMNLFT